MPAPQRQPFDKAEGVENDDAQKRQQEQCGKHGGYLKAVASLDNAPSQPCAGPRTGHKLGHHRPNERQSARYFRPCEDGWKCRREFQINQALPPARA